jgi:hypothetical protein
MSLVVTTAGEKILADVLGAAYNGGPYVIRLFQNDHTPDPADVLADYTEADFSGYAELDLDGWAAAVTVSGRAQIVATLKVWTHSAGAVDNDIYGYYVVNAGGALVWAERDPNAPVTVDTAGQEYNVLPRFTLRLEP